MRKCLLSALIDLISRQGFTEGIGYFHKHLDTGYSRKMKYLMKPGRRHIRVVQSVWSVRSNVDINYATTLVLDVI